MVGHSAVAADEMCAPHGSGIFLYMMITREPNFILFIVRFMKASQLSSRLINYLINNMSYVCWKIWNLEVP